MKKQIQIKEMVLKKFYLTVLRKSIFSSWNQQNILNHIWIVSDIHSLEKYLIIIFYVQRHLGQIPSICAYVQMEGCRL